MELEEQRGTLDSEEGTREDGPREGSRTKEEEKEREGQEQEVARSEEPSRQRRGREDRAGQAQEKAEQDVETTVADRKERGRREGGGRRLKEEDSEETRARDIRRTPRSGREEGGARGSTGEDRGTGKGRGEESTRDTGGARTGQEGREGAETRRESGRGREGAEQEERQHRRGEIQETTQQRHSRIGPKPRAQASSHRKQYSTPRVRMETGQWSKTKKRRQRRTRSKSETTASSSATAEEEQTQTQAKPDMRLVQHVERIWEEGEKEPDGDRPGIPKAIKGAEEEIPKECVEVIEEDGHGSQAPRIPVRYICDVCHNTEIPGRMAWMEERQEMGRTEWKFYDPAKKTIIQDRRDVKEALPAKWQAKIDHLETDIERDVQHIQVLCVSCVEDKTGKSYQKEECDEKGRRHLTNAWKHSARRMKQEDRLVEDSWKQMTCALQRGEDAKTKQTLEELMKGDMKKYRALLRTTTNIGEVSDWMAEMAPGTSILYACEQGQNPVHGGNQHTNAICPIHQGAWYRTTTAWRCGICLNKHTAAHTVNRMLLIELPDKGGGPTQYAVAKQGEIDDQINTEIEALKALAIVRKMYDTYDDAEVADTQDAIYRAILQTAKDMEWRLHKWEWFKTMRAGNPTYLQAKTVIGDERLSLVKTGTPIRLIEQDGEPLPTMTKGMWMGLLNAIWTTMKVPKDLPRFAHGIEKKVLQTLNKRFECMEQNSFQWWQKRNATAAKTWHAEEKEKLRKSIQADLEDIANDEVEATGGRNRRVTIQSQ